MHRTLCAVSLIVLGACAAPDVVERTYHNPVIARDCPDPGVLAVPGEPPTFHLVSTGGRMPVRRSHDLVRWEWTDASILPAGKPDWAQHGHKNWAPELHLVDGRVVACFTSVDGDGRLCIGVASADSPMGPFEVTDAPLVQHADGAIDPHIVHDTDGTPHLVYKLDGNAHGRPTPILIRELAPDGLSFAPGSEPAELLRNDPTTWEGGVVEAPWIVWRDGFWYLFYSGNVYDHRYRTGVARGTTLRGPYEKLGRPLLENDGQWVGPGHGCVVRVGEQDWFVHHAWPRGPDGQADRSRGRQVLIQPITWVDGWPRIGEPGDLTAGGRPAPRW